LQQCPKWRRFEESNEASAAAAGGKRKERPIGSKKAKQLKKDMDLVAQISGMSRDKANEKEQSLLNHQLAQQKFMNQVGSGMSAFAAVLSEQNDVKLLEMMTPRTRNKMAKQMFRVKMQKMMDTCANTSNVLGSWETEDESQKEVRGDTYDDSPGDNRVKSPGGTLLLPVHARNQASRRNMINLDSDDNDDED
jgi:hypothetical protein